MAGVPGPGGGDAVSGGDYTPKAKQTYEPYTRADGVLMVPRTDANGNLIEYVPQDTQKVPGGLPPDQSYPGAEPGPGAPPATGPVTPSREQMERVNQWYQQYLGRGAGDQEIMNWIYDHPDLRGVEEGIAGSAEAKAYATAHPAAPAAGGPAAGAATPGYDPNKLKAALMASGVPANAAELAKFIAAHPEFATGVTIGGSKKNKLYGPGGVFLADVIRGTDSGSPAWDWDASTGGGGGAAGAGAGTGINGDYLGDYPGGSFEESGNADLGDPFTYEDFQQPGNFQRPDEAAMLADPSYQFRKDQAMGALANSASGRGLTNSGGTIYDLLGTASNFASTEYGNIWDREFKTWQDKYQTALNTYATNRGNAADVWASGKGLAKDYYTREKDAFDQSVKDFYDQRDAAWDKQYKMAALGAGVTTAP